MKIQHYAIIFIILILPFSIICRSTINEKIDTLNDETRINNALDTATMDAVERLIEFDAVYYDMYNGEALNVTSSVAQEALNTFFDSMALNYTLPFTYGTNVGKEYFSTYIPAVLVIAYDGFYIYSIEETAANTLEYVLSPKIPYSYEENGYIIKFSLGNYIEVYTPDGYLYKGTYKEDFIDEPNVEDIYTLYSNYLTSDISKYMVQLTDDMSLIMYSLTKSRSDVPKFLYATRSEGVSMLADYSVTNTESGNVSLFHKTRREVIKNIIIDTLNEKMNKHNVYAEMMGVNYVFNLPTIDDDEWINAVNDISIMAFMQGVPVGYHSYYNSYALGASRIMRRDYLYATEDTDGKKRYHEINCELLKSYLDDDNIPNDNDYIKDIFFTKEEAAKHGYYPCMECVP